MKTRTWVQNEAEKPGRELPTDLETGRSPAELLSDLVLKHVVVKSKEEYPPNAAELPMSTDANKAIDDPSVNVVVELSRSRSE